MADDILRLVVRKPSFTKCVSSHYNTSDHQIRQSHLRSQCTRGTPSQRICILCTDFPEIVSYVCFPEIFRA